MSARVLVIDNYDSFTFNLVQYLGELSAEVTAVRNDRITAEQALENGYTHVVVSPGPGVPAAAGVSLEVIRRSRGRVPVLGVCLGHQALGEAFGGQVVRAPAPVHGKSATICHDGRTIFRGLQPRFAAARYHSLIVERESLPSVLEISAHTPDGIIMGLRHREWPLEGVQFHPESVLTGEGKRLLKNFLEMRA